MPEGAIGAVELMNSSDVLAGYSSQFHEHRSNAAQVGVASPAAVSLDFHQVTTLALLGNVVPYPQVD